MVQKGWWNEPNEWELKEMVWLIQKQTLGRTAVCLEILSCLSLFLGQKAWMINYEQWHANINEYHNRYFNKATLNAYNVESASFDTVVCKSGETGVRDAQHFKIED